MFGINKRIDYLKTKILTQKREMENLTLFLVKLMRKVAESSCGFKDGELVWYLDSNYTIRFGVINFPPVDDETLGVYPLDLLCEQIYSDKKIWVERKTLFLAGPPREQIDRRLVFASEEEARAHLRKRFCDRPEEGAVLEKKKKGKQKS